MASGIVNAPNDWSREIGNPRNIIDLPARIVTGSLAITAIVDTRRRWPCATTRTQRATEAVEPPSSPDAEGTAPRPVDTQPGAAPPASPRDEIAHFLQVDETRLGDVYRWRGEGLTPQQMAQAAGVPNVGFVYSYGSQLDALLDGQLPINSAHLSRQTAARVRGWLKKQAWRPSTEEYLRTLEERLNSIANDESTIAKEESEAKKRTVEAEISDVPGIYVYSLPHYLRHPYDPDRGHTLLKVGRSSVDVFGRIGQQARTTALPEDPVLLRIYRADSELCVDVERYFHSFLDDADHSRSPARRGGREWFLTTTKFLDRLAMEKGLDITVVNELDTPQE